MTAEYREQCLKLLQVIEEVKADNDSLKAELAALRAQRMPMTGNQMDLLTTGSGAKLFISADQFASIVRAVEAFHDIKAQP